MNIGDLRLFKLDEKINIKAVRISQVLISKVLTKMLEIQNRLEIKQNLLSEIEQLKNHLETLIDYPITDLEIQPQKVQFIETLTLALEKLNPFPQPLLYGSSLLDGAWLLQYSTALEIRSSLTFTFRMYGRKNLSSN